MVIAFSIKEKEENLAPQGMQVEVVVHEPYTVGFMNQDACEVIRFAKDREPGSLQPSDKCTLQCIYCTVASSSGTCGC